MQFSFLSLSLAVLGLSNKALATPPACLLLCAQEIARSTSCTKLNDISCMCSNESDAFQQCLQSSCPNDNASIAVSSFESVCKGVANVSVSSSSSYVASSSSSTTSSSSSSSSTSTPEDPTTSSTTSEEPTSTSTTTTAPTTTTTVAPTSTESTISTTTTTTTSSSTDTSSVSVFLNNGIENKVEGVWGVAVVGVVAMLI